MNPNRIITRFVVMATVLSAGTGCNTFFMHGPACQAAKDNCDAARDYRKSLKGEKDAALRELERLCAESKRDCYQSMQEEKKEEQLNNRHDPFR